MKLGTRFAVLASSIAALTGVVLALVLLVWEYDTRKTLWLTATEARVSANPRWPLMTHYRDRPSMDAEISVIENHVKPLSYSRARHIDGSTITSTLPKSGSLALPERADNDRLVTTVTYQPAPKGLFASEPGWLGYAVWADEILTLSIPVMSPVNPLDANVTYDEYRRRLADDAGARFAVGYVEMGVTTQALLASMSATATRILAGIALVLLLALWAIRGAARSISKPLAHIASVAQSMSENELPENPRLPINRPDEIGQIAAVLNTAIESIHRIRAKVEVDRSLLSMKVASTNKKLTRAEAQVDRSKDQIKRVAYFDSVTGLPNRRLLLEQLGMLMTIAARERRHLGLMLVDMENLRRINESMGREAGDQILREVTKRIIATTRDSDLVSRESRPQDVARVSNDEFCVLLHGINQPADALAAANRVYEALHAPIVIGKHQLQIKFNVGVAVAPDHAKRPDELARAADVAINNARAQGLTGPNMFDASMDEKGSERFQLELDLRAAVYDDQFELHYQPQIDTLSGELVGAEALIRWNHPERGMIPPFKFITIAEESGLIVELGTWILHRAAKDLAEMRGKGLVIPKLSVNVSALQLTDSFIEEVRAAVVNNQLEPNTLELELTESLLVQSVDTVMGYLTTLREEIGVRLSVDDFGTGYSSLAYLSRFPLNELKVDRSFVMAMEQDQTAAKVTGAIIAIGRELALEIVVEGIETPEQLERLQALGATIIQGYLFSKPLIRNDLEQYIAQRPYTALLAQLKSATQN